MNSVLAICLLALIPACAGLNCYYCATGQSGCNDPFSASGANVTYTGSNSTNVYCVKQGVTSALVARYGAPTCTNTPFVFGIGFACCQTDLCNGAQASYQVSFLVLLGFLATFFKLY